MADLRASRPDTLPSGNTQEFFPSRPDPSACLVEDVMRGSPGGRAPPRAEFQNQGHVVSPGCRSLPQVC